VGAALPALADFSAYNDCGWAAGEPAVNISTGSPAGQLTVPLLDRISGTPLPATATFSAGASPYAFPIDLPAGSDAFALFAGHISCSNYAYASIPITLTLTGLNAAHTYSFALFSTRGSAAEKYSNRWTDVTLAGADAFTNHSSTGALRFTTALTYDSTRILAANLDGQVARYTAIRSGTDGIITVTLTPGATNGETPTAYVEAFLLKEQSAITPPLPTSFTVAGGALLLNGWLVTPALAIGTGATVRGSGSLSGTLTLGGTVSPGAATGTVTGHLRVGGEVLF